MNTLLSESQKKGTPSLREDVSKLIHDIQNELQNEAANDGVASYSVHANFISKLQSISPQLTKNDIRLCLYIKLGFSSAEIGGFLNITENSVTVRRSRVRTKLNLPEGSNFKEFLNSI